MRRTTIVATVMGAGLLLTGAIAQQEDHQHSADGKKADMACCENMPGMNQGMNPAMMQQMMPMMHQMMMGNTETAKLVDQLVNSMAAIETEKNGKALKEKLAAHAALLKELQTKMQAQSGMMQQHMGPMMMGGDHKP